MSNSGISIGDADRRFIIAKSGGRCNKCRREIFIQNEFGERARLGDDAHIIACSDFGPRANPKMPSKQRNSIENLILLCKICHSEVDQQVKEYTEEKLREIRDRHYDWVESRLSSTAVSKPRFHYLLYVNVPRADMYAAIHSMAVPSLPFGDARSFRDLGIKAGALMAAYTGVLNVEDLYANELRDSTALEELSAGSYWFSQEARFRTRKIGKYTDLQAAWKRNESIVYRKFDDWELICLVDPRWITTSTAYVTLTNGAARMCGLIHINNIDVKGKKAIASPLFLGVPDRSILGGIFP